MKLIRNLAFACLLLSLAAWGEAASAQDQPTYRAPIRYPQFGGRDRAFRGFRTRIIEGMRAGPNFAGHYRIIEVGCGMGCRFVFVADLATGRVVDFPLGGEEYYAMDLRYGIRSTAVRAEYIKNSDCMVETLTWIGARFRLSGALRVGGEAACYAQ